MQVVPSSSSDAQNDAWKKLPFRLIEHKFLTYTTTLCSQLDIFYRDWPLQNAIREIFLDHLKKVEQNFNVQHEQTLAVRCKDLNPRACHEIEQALLSLECKALFSQKCYTGTVQLKQNGVFTQNRWFELICAKFELTDSQKQEGYDLIFKKTFNQELLNRSQDTNPKTPFALFSHLAWNHIEACAHAILDQANLKGGLKGHEDVCKTFSFDQRKILIAHCFGKTYVAIRELLTGIAETIKNELKKHPEYTSSLMCSMRIIPSVQQTENPLRQHALGLESVCEENPLQTNKSLDITALQIAPAKLHNLCITFYDKVARVQRLFSDFYVLLKIQKEEDLSYFITTSVPLSSSPRSNASGSPLLDRRLSATRLTPQVSRRSSGVFGGKVPGVFFDECLTSISEVEHLFNKICMARPPTVQRVEEGPPMRVDTTDYSYFVPIMTALLDKGFHSFVLELRSLLCGFFAQRNDKYAIITQYKASYIEREKKLHEEYAAKLKEIWHKTNGDYSALLTAEDELLAEESRSWHKRVTYLRQTPLKQDNETFTPDRYIEFFLNQKQIEDPTERQAFKDIFYRGRRLYSFY
jgi:hypothetical protein